MSAAFDWVLVHTVKSTCSWYPLDRPSLHVMRPHGCIAAQVDMAAAQQYQAARQACYSAVDAWAAAISRVAAARQTKTSCHTCSNAAHCSACQELPRLLASHTAALQAG